MKLILPIICSLLLAGCSETAQTSPQSEKAAPSVSTPESKSSSPSSTMASTSTLTEDAGSLFTQKCASCHGMKGEKSALSKSLIIADLTEQQIKDALKGYQAGTYGKEMKGLMQAQVKSLSANQIDALAKHITTL